MHEPLATSEDEVVPTITTVARLANVSVASASRVLNGIRTSPDTLERVTAAAESVGYVPNAAARSLRSRRTGQIAFAMPDVGNPVYTAMVASIQEVARVAGVRLLLHSTGADSDDELAMIRDLRHRHVDGLILACLHVTQEHAAELSSSAAPVVVIGRPTDGAPRWTRCGPTRAAGRPRPFATSTRSAAPGSRSSTGRRTPPRARRGGAAISTGSAPAGCPATRS